MIFCFSVYIDLFETFDVEGIPPPIFVEHIVFFFCWKTQYKKKWTFYTHYCLMSFTLFNQLPHLWYLGFERLNYVSKRCYILFGSTVWIPRDIRANRYSTSYFCSKCCVFIFFENHSWKKVDVLHALLFHNMYSL